MTRREKFLEYANEIKNLGYTVFVCQDETFNYGYVINDKDQIGYFQLGDYGYGVRFSTKHKPAKGIGSGFSIDDWDECKTEMTREIVDRCFAVAPDWYRNIFGEDGPIVKWSAKEYLEKPFTKIRLL